MVYGPIANIYISIYFFIHGVGIPDVGPGLTTIGELFLVEESQHAIDFLGTFPL